ncbi:MAG: tetratricopeptide repeat protein [Firmicutes bacterium]|nr:tetratricopeptide repeat protein [Bacillota bacterium]
MKMPPIDQRRVREKMDEYMSRRDYAGAEKHLLYWLEEARMAGDLRGELMVRGELIGHFRKTGNREGALHQSDEALRLLEEMEFGGTITSGTTYVNIATACNAFGENERSLQMFQKAQQVYESIPSTEPQLLGGLYNNMALTLVSLRRFEEAMSYYEKALAQMAKVPGGELEQAITYLNMADVWDLQLGSEEAESKVQPLVDKACELLEKRPESVEEGYYAFVCEKCAPSFEYYGYFLAAEELKERARKIYERT